MDYSRVGSRDHHFKRKSRDRGFRRIDTTHGPDRTRAHKQHLRLKARSELTPEEIEDIGNPVTVLSRIQKEPLRCLKSPTRLFVPRPKIQTDGQGFQLLDLIKDSHIRDFLEECREECRRMAEKEKIPEKQATRSRSRRHYPFLGRLLGFLK